MGLLLIGSYELLKGFVSGLHAGNYDITHIFIDNFFKLAGDKSPEKLDEFVAWLEAFSVRENVEFVLSVSAEAETAGELTRKHLI